MKINVLEEIDGVMTEVVREITPEEIAAMPIKTVSYEEQVNALIRQRYSLSNELAILRQRDTKPEEFAAYNEFCEACKAHAKNG